MQRPLLIPQPGQNQLLILGKAVMTRLFATNCQLEHTQYVEEIPAFDSPDTVSLEVFGQTDPRNLKLIWANKNEEDPQLIKLCIEGNLVKVSQS